jgi:hypothetical protein
MFLVVNEAEEQKKLKKSKLQQILANLLLSFRVFPLVLIVGQPKKSRNNWTKFHASANKIPESAEILIFSKKFPALWARSSPETC